MCLFSPPPLNFTILGSLVVCPKRSKKISSNFSKWWWRHQYDVITTKNHYFHSALMYKCLHHQKSQRKYYLWCQITQNALWINREKNTYHLHCLGVGYHIPFTVYFPIMPHSLCVSIIRMQHCMQQLRNISAKKNPMTVKFSGNACNR